MVIFRLFQGHCQTKLIIYRRTCSNLYREEKEIDVINRTGKRKYEALYLQTNTVYYGKTISSFDALRPLLSSGLSLWSCKFAPFLFLFHLSMSKVGLPLMGDTAGFSLLFSALLHFI